MDGRMSLLVLIGIVLSGAVCNAYFVYIIIDTLRNAPADKEDREAGFGPFSATYNQYLAAAVGFTCSMLFLFGFPLYMAISNWTLLITGYSW